MPTFEIFLTLVSSTGVAASLTGFPGAAIVFIVILIKAVNSGFAEVSLAAVLLAGLITLISFFIDNLMIFVGAKKYGATKFGIIGAFSGTILGFLTLGPIGILVGPLVGAMVGELIGNPNKDSVLKAGLGAFVGFLIGFIFKITITFSLFVWSLFIIW